MSVTPESIRIAALICWFEAIEHELDLVSLRDKIRSEIWCLRNGVSTRGFEDITVANMSTSTIIENAVLSSKRSREQQIALLLCTLREVS